MQTPANTTADRSSSLRARKKARTAEALFDAAMVLFLERSYDEVSVDDICARAEVGRATFFRIYGTKAGLITEFNTRIAAEARRQIASSTRSTPEQLGIIAECIAHAWASSSPAMASIVVELLTSGIGGRMLVANASDGEPNATDELLELTTDVVRHGIHTRELSIGATPVRVVSFVVYTALVACVTDWITAARTGDLPTAMHDALGILLDGLRNPA